MRRSRFAAVKANLQIWKRYCSASPCRASSALGIRVGPLTAGLPKPMPTRTGRVTSWSFIMASSKITLSLKSGCVVEACSSARRPTLKSLPTWSRKRSSAAWATPSGRRCAACASRASPPRRRTSTAGRSAGPTRGSTARRSARSPRCLPRSARRCCRCPSSPSATTSTARAPCTSTDASRSSAPTTAASRRRAWARSCACSGTAASCASHGGARRSRCARRFASARSRARP